MLEKLHGIVLQTIRHNDRNNIVTLFTAERGRISCLCPTGTSRAARLRRARMAPLAVVETEINFRAGRELQFLGDIAAPMPWRNLYFDPVKGAMTTFISEFLNRLLRTSESDLPMWNYLLHAIGALDALQRGMANYHLVFLLRLLRFAGIEPDMSTFRPDRYFDLRGGIFTDMVPLHRDFLMPADACRIQLLLRMNFRNLHLFKFNVDERRHILGILLRYYSLHLPMPSDFTSLEILREIFA